MYFMDGYLKLSRIKSDFHIYRHEEVIHISLEAILLDRLSLLYDDDKARRGDCNNWRIWTWEEFFSHFQEI